MQHPVLRVLALLLLLLQAGVSLVRGQSLCIGLDGHVVAHRHASNESALLHRHASTADHVDGLCHGWHADPVVHAATDRPALHGHDVVGVSPHSHLHLQMPEVESEGRSGAISVPNVAGLHGPTSLVAILAAGDLSSDLALAGDLAWSCCDARRGISATCLRL